LNLEQEVHHTASKLRILGFEPRKDSPLIKPRDFRIPQWQTWPFEGMSIRPASRLPSTLTCKLQAQYITHEPPPAIPRQPIPNQWLDGTYVFRNAPIADPTTQRSPALAGLSSGGKPSKVSTADAVPSRRVQGLAPPLRQRCDGDHKNALFCRVLQKISACMTAKPVACPLSRTDAS
jgi:hypothetical protein